MTNPTDCPFCDLAPDRILRSAPHARAIPDAYPVTPGHTLVVPTRHVAGLYDLPAEEQAALWELAGEVRAALVASHDPDGFNIGINDGEAAGQTVGHAHIHVIPRYGGDVPDPRGGIRWVVPEKAVYWEEE
ncbi:MAG: HIT family protein [Longimicrobiales bacterium]